MENPEHCDFSKLRSLLIRSFMLDLISTTEETYYESYRLAQMETRKFGEAKVRRVDNPKYKEEEEGLRKRFTEQVKLEENRFRQWEQHVSPALCRRLWPGHEDASTDQEQGLTSVAHCGAGQAESGP